TPRPFDLAHLLDDIVGTYAAATRADDPLVRLILERGTTLSVSGREGPFGQVFRNLIDNARSFSAPGGEVRVTAGPTAQDLPRRGPPSPATTTDRACRRRTSRPSSSASTPHGRRARRSAPPPASASP